LTQVRPACKLRKAEIESRTYYDGRWRKRIGCKFFELVADKVSHSSRFSTKGSLFSSDAADLGFASLPLARWGSEPFFVEVYERLEETKYGFGQFIVVSAAGRSLIAVSCADQPALYGFLMHLLPLIKLNLEMSPPSVSPSIEPCLPQPFDKQSESGYPVGRS